MKHGDGYELVKGKELSHKQVREYIRKFFTIFGKFKIQEQYIAPTNKRHIVLIEMEPSWILNAQHLKNIDNITADCIDIVSENFRFIIQTSKAINQDEIDRQDWAIAEYKYLLNEQKKISNKYRKVCEELLDGIKKYSSK